MSKFQWINNTYIYVWPCSLDLFDYIIDHMKILKVENSFFEYVRKRIDTFDHLVEGLYSLNLKFLGMMPKTLITHHMNHLIWKMHINRQSKKLMIYFLNSINSRIH